jgi:DNA repair exonuclease SbcCD ATPase subunit
MIGGDTMSMDKENTLEDFDNLRKAVVKLLDEHDRLTGEVDSYSSEAEELRSAKREAEEKSWAAEERADKAESALEESESKLKSSTEELETLRADTTKDSEIDDLRKERDELRSEMDEINSKLSRVSELYRETSAEKEKLQEKVDVSDLLAIYIILIENIFGGKPHARVLYTLHNTKTAITRKNIESSTGIMATAVMKAIHDLRNAELVSYDDDTQEVKLIKEIM